MRVKRCTLALRLSSLLFIGFLVLGGRLGAQYYGVDHHIYINSGCYVCGYTANQSPTDPSERCIGVGDGEEGMGTSCSEYYVGDGWVCEVPYNPCYNTVVHASLTTGGAGVGDASREAVAAALAPACLRISAPVHGSRPAR
jgi:hypothetical protein